MDIHVHTVSSPLNWHLQSTPDNSNFQGKSSTTVWVIGSSKQITKTKDWMRRGRNASTCIMYTFLQGQQEIYWYFEKKSRATKLWLVSTALNIVFELDSDKKVKNLKEKENTIVLREIQCFGLQFTAFFSKFHALKTWFEFSRVKLYRTDLKENKNYFELAGGSSYRG